LPENNNHLCELPKKINKTNTLSMEKYFIFGYFFQSLEVKQHLKDFSIVFVGDSAGFRLLELLSLQKDNLNL